MSTANGGIACREYPSTRRHAVYRRIRCLRQFTVTVDDKTRLDNINFIETWMIPSESLKIEFFFLHGNRYGAVWSGGKAKLRSVCDMCESIAGMVMNRDDENRELYVSEIGEDVTTTVLAVCICRTFCIPDEWVICWRSIINPKTFVCPCPPFVVPRARCHRNITTIVARAIHKYDWYSMWVPGSFSNFTCEEKADFIIFTCMLAMLMDRMVTNESRWWVREEYSRAGKQSRRFETKFENRWISSGSRIWEWGAYKYQCSYCGDLPHNFITTTVTIYQTNTARQV
jgi:hypothetical protein